MQRSILALLSVLIVLMFGASARADDADFSQWLTSFKEKAKAEGISARVVDDAFMGLEEDDSVVTLDRKQPENKITLAKYLSNTISTRRIENGRQVLRDNAELLSKISAQYGVQPKYIVALWAIESDFGDHQGNFSVVRSLATLAYEGRRAEFFGKELISALKILDNENIPKDELTGSWAGAMGGCQFMPSTYHAYAVDADGDGKRDIWNSEADVFASIANYLHSLGWNTNQEWGRAIIVPENLARGNMDIKRGHTAAYWRKHGLKHTDGTRVSDGDAIYYAIYAGSEADGAYLVSENFKALLNWNRSRYFATAVGTLADAIGE